MPTAKLQILLIEDNLADAELIKEMLSGVRGQEYVVHHVRYLAEGLRLFESQSFDCVLVDLGLPDSRGLESALAVRSHSKRVPIIVLTLLDDEDMALSSLQSDVQDYLIKGDINSTVLARSIRYAIQRKLVAERLRESEQKLSRVFHAAPALIIISTLREGKIIEANQTALETFGYRRDEFVGRSVRELEVWEDFSLRTKIVEDLESRRQVKNIEVRYRSRAGQEVVGLLSAELIEIEGERFLLTFVRDITERKRAEVAVLKAQMEWERTFDSVPDLIGILDVEHRFLQVNRAMAEKFGRPPGECIGVPCHVLVHGTDTPPESCPHLKTLADLQEHEVQVYDEHLGGHLLVTTTPLRGLDGKILGVVYVARNISELKGAEQEIKRLNAELEKRAVELEAANKELQAFNYSVAHDLRQPLNLISTCSQAIVTLCGETLDPVCLEFAEKSYQACLRMSRLIEVLLDFARLSHLAPVREELDLSSMARTVAQELRSSSPERRVIFRIHDGIQAEGDAKLLRVVLDNLLGNAWKYTSAQEEGVIEFGRAEIGGLTAFFVRDNGVGFEQAEAEKLFTPFQRLSGTEDFRGFGIGLAIVERIILRHGGKVWAEGTPGKGATFYFTLPGEVGGTEQPHEGEPP